MEFNLRAHSITVQESDRTYAETKLTTALKKVLGGSTARVDVEVSAPSRSSGKPLTEVDVHVFIARAKTQVVKVKAEELRDVVAAYLIDVERVGDDLCALSQREKIRAAGPTV